MSDTKTRILETGLRLWMVDPSYVTMRRIAHELDMTHGTVSYHCKRGEMGLRDMIAYHAVQQGEARVIAALIAERHRAVAHMTDAQRLDYMRLAAG